MYAQQIPIELAWLVPIVVPFLIGLLTGVIVKRVAKLLLAVVALIALLAFAGYIHVNLRDVYERALNALPKLIETGEAIRDILPYSSATFLIGLAIGLWKG